MSAPNNIYGGGGRRSAMSSIDFYRRVPKDLTEVRRRGRRATLGFSAAALPPFDDAIAEDGRRGRERGSVGRAAAGVVLWPTA